MANIFYLLYTLTSRHKVLFFSTLLVLVTTSAFMASKIKLEENIASIIPKDQDLAEINEAFEDFKMNNRLIVHFYHKDTTAANDPDKLINTAHRFNDSLIIRYGHLIAEVKLSFPDANLEKMYAHYTNHLPVYLQPSDYDTINQRTQKENLDPHLRKNLKALMSPIGMVTKKMLVQDPFSLVSMPLQRARGLQLDDRVQLYQNHLLSKDRQHLIYFISLQNPASETSRNGELVEGINSLIKDFAVQETNTAIEYFGSAAVAVANAGRIKQDIYLTVGFALLALFLFISLYYRNFLVFFIAVTPGIFGAVVAIAVLVLVRSKVSVISLGVGSVLLGITIDYALHLFTHAKHQRDIKQLFEDITLPLLMSSLTTACAFIALVFLRSDALAELGIFAGISVVAASLYTLMVLPHFRYFKQKEPAKAQTSTQINFVERTIDRLAHFPLHRRKFTWLIFTVLTLISLFTWRHYSFERNMLRLNYMPEHLARYEANLNKIAPYTANNLFLISSGANLWEALEKEAKMQDKLDSLQARGTIDDYLLIGDIIPPRSVQQERLKKWREYWSEEKVSEFLPAFYQSARQVGFQPGSFKQFGQLLQMDYSLLSAEDAAGILSIVGEEMIINSKERVSVITTVKTNPHDKPLVMAEVDKIQDTLVFDKAYVTAHLVDLLQEDFNVLVNISMVVVFLIILLCYGRIELAVITFAPILLSWLWILGLMGLLGLSFNIVNIIVCTFIFGLGIDYSIFVMRGLTQHYKIGLNTIFSYKKSILLSAITTLLGIGVLVLAEHPALRSIALLAIIGILSVILLTFTIQPVLYDLLIQRRKEQGLPPYTLLSLLLSIFAFAYFLLGCVLLMLIRLLLWLPLGPIRKRKAMFHYIMMLFCRSLIKIMVNVKKEIVNPELADFTKPSVIISNHHSFLDIMLLLMFHPKVVMVTNSWVYHSPFFGKAVQFADFIQAGSGVESRLEQIRQLVQEGYSIIVFPEGTRSEGFSLGRFHKGAFYLANTLQLDIQPVLLHGTNYTMPKQDGFHLKSGRVTVKFLPRIAYDDQTYGANYSERTKNISRYFKQEYQQLRQLQETPAFFREVIIKNYVYKGPVLEWYLRVKWGLEKSYQLFHRLIPDNAKVVDLGCGYGFLAYSLALSGEKRQVMAIDYDADKIEVAKHCPVKPSNLSFDHGDVTTYPYGAADVFVVSDVLHYLLPQEQNQLLNNMLKQLNPGGRIILRDGDSSKKERHQGTRLTEVFSTGSGFNKTKNELHFISGDMIANFAAQNKLELEIIDNTTLTSNTVFILKHKATDGTV